MFDNYVACTVERTPSGYAKSTEAFDFDDRYKSKTVLLGGKLGYRQTFNKRRVLVGDKIDDHWDAAAPTASPFST